jgi:hypothetical protein
MKLDTFPPIEKAGCFEVKYDVFDKMTIQTSFYKHFLIGHWEQQKVIFTWWFNTNWKVFLNSLGIGNCKWRFRHIQWRHYRLKHFINPLCLVFKSRVRGIISFCFWGYQKAASVKLFQNLPRTFSQGFKVLSCRRRWSFLIFLSLLTL